jgi:hypothetical protein
MKVLLKEGADAATSETVLVLPQVSGDTLETLSGDSVPKGIVTEAGEKAITAALNVALAARKDEFISAKDLQKDLIWLNKVLADYELGSKIGLKASPSRFTLDDSEATWINRAEGLAPGDRIAVGPSVSPKTAMNAHGQVLSISRDKVLVDG